MKTGFARREFLMAIGAAGAAVSLKGCARAAKPRVVVVGGGFGGASCAKYINRIDPGIDVVVVERNREYVTCPFSNNVIGGLRTLGSLTHGYEGLGARDGITVVIDTATAVDAQARTVSLAGGNRLAYDRLVLSPGIAIRWGALDGYDEAAAEAMPHAWKAGPQTLLLKRQLAAMEDGGTVVIAAPEYPYRCPPAPYERASMVAHYLKTNGKARSKIVILDAKDTIPKQALFEQGWGRFYEGMIEWVPRGQGGTATRVDPATKTVYAEAGEFKADVACIVPPQSAGGIAISAGAADEDGWCPIDPWTLESTLRPGVHVLGDSCIAGAMPKSGFSANSQAKVCAAAIVALLNDSQPPEPVFMNTCYSTIAPDYGISIYGAYRATEHAIVAVLGSVSLSPLDAPDEVRKAEFEYAQGWLASMTGEMFG
ncbi:MAG: FCSD flavin-binding domain-containing protein [Alphaproteobacteria bacterium]